MKENEVIFTYTSSDGDDKYPGEVHASVMYRLEVDKKDSTLVNLRIEFKAELPESET